MENANSITIELDHPAQERMLALAAAGNWKRREVPYSQCSIEGEGFNAILYREKKGVAKLVVQGRTAGDFVLFRIEPEVTLRAVRGYEDVLDPAANAPHMGTDESGKGDYFGPLVVCAAYTDESLAPAMREAGARDCKTLSDRQVLASGAALRKLLGPQRFAVVRVGPAAYNKLYARIGSLNRLLAWAHARCIEDMLVKNPSIPRAVADQFGASPLVIKRALMERGRKIELEQRHKAENDIAVAAASVIARELFLRAIADYAEDLGLEQGEKPPKGSSDPRIRELAERAVRKHGPEFLLAHCKCHFQTTDKVLAACGRSRADLPPEGRVLSAVKNGEYRHVPSLGDS